MNYFVKLDVDAKRYKPMWVRLDKVEAVWLKRLKKCDVIVLQMDSGDDNEIEDTPGNRAALGLD